VPEPENGGFMEEFLRLRQALEQEIEDQRPSVSENREGVRQDKLQQFWEEHPDAHQAVFGAKVNPFTGEVRGGDFYERQHNWPQHTVFDPASFPKGFLDWLKTEMKYNPEMKEKR